MQKPKPIEYLQAILYHIKYNWQAIVMATLITTTVLLGLSYAATGKDLYYIVGAGAGLVTIITAVVIFAPELGRAMDKFRLREVPEDEEG
jgi:bacteriorhodopsin